MAKGLIAACWFVLFALTKGEVAPASCFQLLKETSKPPSRSFCT